MGWGGPCSPTFSPFDHVLIDHGGDDGQCHHVPSPCQHLRELLILRERAGGSMGCPALLSIPLPPGFLATSWTPQACPAPPGHSPTFMPMTFWPFTSQMQWWVRSPLRAAELSLASDTIFPFFTTMPMWPVLSLCTVTVRWKGLWGEHHQCCQWHCQRHQCHYPLTCPAPP